MTKCLIFTCLGLILVFFKSQVLLANQLTGKGDVVSLTQPDSSFRPSVGLDVGGELFYKYGLHSNRHFGGLAAIMIDVDYNISRNITGFGAFHFDSSPFYDFMNRSFQTEDSEHPDIELHVEEFFVEWTPVTFFRLKAGRRYSRFSQVNQLHLADFQFSTKPRILTAYMGDNHGLALDGVSMQWLLHSGSSTFWWLTELEKTGFSGEDLSFTTVLNWRLAIGSSNLMVRTYGFFDHQQRPDNRLFNSFAPDEYALLPLDSVIGLNAWGGSVRFEALQSSGRPLILHAELMNRRVSDRYFTGGFAFVHYGFAERWIANMMYQQLDVPFIADSDLDFVTERSLTLGLSFIATPDQRIRLEYSYFHDSPFFDDMLLLKYTFQLGL